jgi:phosphoglycerate-specific signal transduction histidine kinase
MKILKRIKLNTVISLGTVILILLSLAVSFRMIFIADRNMALIYEMRKVAFERILLRDEYLLYREERAKTQWYAKSETFRSLLAQADTRFDQGETKVLLQNARKDFDATVSGFSKVIEGHESRNLGAQKNPDFIEAQSRLTSQVLLRAYSLTDNINRLQESAQQTATNARNRGVFIVVLFILTGILAIILNSTVINRTLTKRIAVLNDGVEIIGAGDLDHRITVEGDDELSALALASNEMAAKLKQSYTSVDNLQMEIYERMRAEDALRKNDQFLLETQLVAGLGTYEMDLTTGQ